MSDPLPEGVELTELPGGLRVVTEAMPSVRSVALGLWVQTGSRNETLPQAGLSHFLEHLLFKGTARYSAIEISEIFDGMGAAVNAGTSKESTNLYARVLDEHTERAFDLLGEMMLAPTFPDIDSERQVVIEEIAMYEDEPSDRVHDVLAEAIFGDTELGRRILGDADVIGDVPIPDIDAYHRSRYRPPSIVVGAAGSLEHDQIVEMAERFMNFPDGAQGDAAPAEPAQVGEGGSFRFYPKETEQYHICFGAPGLSRGDDRRFALRVLNTIFGGSSSSRLFREVREKRGLAYSVGSYSEEYVDQGLVGMYVGTRKENVAEACEVIGNELDALRVKGVTPEELNRAKESLKGRTVLGMESTSARMGRISSATLFAQELLSLDQILDRIDGITAAEVADLATTLYAPELISAACIGTDEELFRGSVGPISESLAVAG